MPYGIYAIIRFIMYDLLKFATDTVQYAISYVIDCLILPPLREPSSLGQSRPRATSQRNNHSATK